VADGYSTTSTGSVAALGTLTVSAPYQSKPAALALPCHLGPRPFAPPLFPTRTQTPFPTRSPRHPTAANAHTTTADLSLDGNIPPPRFVTHNPAAGATASSVAAAATPCAAPPPLGTTTAAVAVLRATPSFRVRPRSPERSPPPFSASCHNSPSPLPAAPPSPPISISSEPSRSCMVWLSAHHLSPRAELSRRRKAVLPAGRCVAARAVRSARAVAEGGGGARGCGGVACRPSREGQFRRRGSGRDSESVGGGVGGWGGGRGGSWTGSF